MHNIIIDNECILELDSFQNNKNSDFLKLFSGIGNLFILYDGSVWSAAYVIQSIQSMPLYMKCEEYINVYTCIRQPPVSVRLIVT
jgi:hypothetical protein